MTRARPAVEDEVLVYLTAYSLTAVVSELLLRPKLKSLAKRHTALLVLQQDLQRGALFRSKRSTSFRSYLLETVSDLSQAILLFCHGLYKPANHLLRSAVENGIRCVGIAESANALSVNSTFDLIRVVRQTNIVQSSLSAKRAYNALTREYDELCKYVHTSDENYMSLTAFLHHYPTYDEVRAASFERSARVIIVSLLSLLSLLFVSRVRQLHHSQSDLVLDVLSNATKLEMNAD